MDHLGITEAEPGQYDKAVESLQGALVLDPTRTTTYANFVVDLLTLNGVEEADAVLADATQHKFEKDYLLEAAYWKALLHPDRDKMQRILLQSSEIARARLFLFAAQAKTKRLVTRSKEPVKRRSARGRGSYN